MVSVHTEIGASVLSSLMDRLGTSSSNPGSKVYLPAVIILHSLINCVTKVTCHSPQIENTIFIIIQKLLAYSQPSFETYESSFMNILTSNIQIPKNYNNSYLNNDGMGTCTGSGAYGFNSSSSTSLRTCYSLSVIGCFLGGHLLLRSSPYSLNVTGRSILILLLILIYLLLFLILLLLRLKIIVLFSIKFSSLSMSSSCFILPFVLSFAYRF